MTARANIGLSRVSSIKESYTTMTENTKGLPNVWVSTAVRLDVFYLTSLSWLMLVETSMKGGSAITYRCSTFSTMRLVHEELSLGNVIW
jgi:hypothetical protein